MCVSTRPQARCSGPSAGCCQEGAQATDPSPATSQQQQPPHPWKLTAGWVGRKWLVLWLPSGCSSRASIDPNKCCRAQTGASSEVLPHSALPVAAPPPPDQAEHISDTGCMSTYPEVRRQNQHAQAGGPTEQVLKELCQVQCGFWPVQYTQDCCAAVRCTLQEISLIIQLVA